MTYKEARDKIRDRHCTHNHYCTDNCMQGEDCCEYAMALNAIEKQIPKTVLEGDNPPYYHCPSCGEAVKFINYLGGLAHCQWCGQTLDWSILNNE